MGSLLYSELHVARLQPAPAARTSIMRHEFRCSSYAGSRRQPSLAGARRARAVLGGAGARRHAHRFQRRRSSRPRVRQDTLPRGAARIREDAVGNTFARWTGTDPELPAVATGSHIDAIPNAGRFDGTVGVLGALEAFRALRRSGICPRRSLELILFTSEEPTRFGVGCLGSRLISSALDPETADDMKDRENRTLAEIRADAGFTGALSSVALEGLPMPHSSSSTSNRGRSWKCAASTSASSPQLPRPPACASHRRRRRSRRRGAHARASRCVPRRCRSRACRRSIRARDRFDRQCRHRWRLRSIPRRHQQCSQPGNSGCGCAGHRWSQTRCGARRDSTGVRRDCRPASRFDRHRDDKR